MRKSYTILFALLVLLFTATSAQALQSKTIDRYNGASASANWYETSGDTTTSTYLSVTESSYGTDVYVEIYTYGPYSESWKYGYMCTQDDVLTIDKKLNSASLSEVQVEVYDCYTGETEILNIQADWVGQGAISKDSYTSRSQSGNYVWRSSGSSSYRDASATGSINGYDLGIGSYATLSNFKSAYMSMEK